MHANALTKEAARLFPHLARFESFYLVGGTALALHIGHRISVDFDLFSERELSPGLRQKVRRVFQDAPKKVTYSVHEQLNVIIHGIKTTFFHYPYPVIDPLIEYHGMRLASIREIAAMKAFSIGKRLSYKDYVDWYFLLREKRVNLPQIITFAQKKFKDEFNARLFLGQLVSIAEVPTLKIDFLRNEVDRETIEQFLESAVRNFKF